jgi:hypothetical protein
MIFLGVIVLVVSTKKAECRRNPEGIVVNVKHLSTPTRTLSIMLSFCSNHSVLETDSISIIGCKGR